MIKIMKVLFLVIGFIVIIGCKQKVTVTVYIEHDNIKVRADQVNVELKGNKQTWNDYTNSQGEVSFTFHNNPREVEYTVSLENHLVSFSENECGIAKEFHGRFKTGNGKEHSANVTLSDDQTIKPWIYLNNAAIAARNIINLEDFHIDGCEGNRNYFSQSKKTITINSSPALHYLEDKVYHEFGHAVMYYAVDGKFSAGDCKSHRIGVLANDSKCAWVEGWADFYALYVKYWIQPRQDIRFTGHDIERYGSSIKGLDAIRDEGRVAAFLWDLYDSNDDYNENENPDYGASWPAQDDNHGISISSMITALNGFYEGNARTFYNKLDKKLDHDQANHGRLIMIYNYINKPVNSGKLD